jgi:hypothetical protein
MLRLTRDYERLSQLSGLDMPGSIAPVPLEPYALTIIGRLDSSDMRAKGSKLINNMIQISSRRVVNKVGKSIPVSAHPSGAVHDNSLSKAEESKSEELKIELAGGLPPWLGWLKQQVDQHGSRLPVKYIKVADPLHHCSVSRFHCMVWRGYCDSPPPVFPSPLELESLSSADELEAIAASIRKQYDAPFFTGADASSSSSAAAASAAPASASAQLIADAQLLADAAAVASSSSAQPPAAAASAALQPGKALAAAATHAISLLDAYIQPGVNRAGMHQGIHDSQTKVFHSMQPKYYIMDLGSLNGLFVKDVKIPELTWVPLAHGDKIRFAPKTLMARRSTVEFIRHDIADCASLYASVLRGGSGIKGTYNVIKPPLGIYKPQDVHIELSFQGAMDFQGRMRYHAEEELHAVGNVSGHKRGRDKEGASAASSSSSSSSDAESLSKRVRTEEATRQAQKIFDEFTCGICTEVIHRVAITKCGHSYCQSCIEEWFATTPRKKKCPVCRCEHVGPLQNMLALDNIITHFIQTHFSEADKHERLMRNIAKAQEKEKPKQGAAAPAAAAAAAPAGLVGGGLLMPGGLPVRYHANSYQVEMPTSIFSICRICHQQIIVNQVRLRGLCHGRPKMFHFDCFRLAAPANFLADHRAAGTLTGFERLPAVFRDQVEAHLDN